VNWEKQQEMIEDLEVQVCKRGAKMTVSYKTMQKNKKLDEFEIEKKEGSEDEENSVMLFDNFFIDTSFC